MQRGMDSIRDRFMWVDRCPYAGPRIFLENAGGSLTLKSVVEASEKFAALPDNSGRPNVASQQIEKEVVAGKAAIRDFFHMDSGEVFIGETGTELIFRIIGAVAVANRHCLKILGSTLEHPASRSACSYWSEMLGGNFRQIEHNSAKGWVAATDYAAAITQDTLIATIVHTSPITGMTVDLQEIAKAIRAVSPDCFIIVDGIQHAAHGPVDLSRYDVDAYVISPYKVFSRHGYGIAWISDRLAKLPHCRLAGSSPSQWELGTRDAGAYATFSKVVAYLDWLGAAQTGSTDRKARLRAARDAIKAHEDALLERIQHGTSHIPGLDRMDRVVIIGGSGLSQREGLVSFAVEGRDCLDIVEQLEAQGIRVHLRKNDHYSGNILTPLNLPSCIRVSVSHYNTLDEIDMFMQILNKLMSVR